MATGIAAGGRLIDSPDLTSMRPRSSCSPPFSKGPLHSKLWKATLAPPGKSISSDDGSFLHHFMERISSLDIRANPPASPVQLSARPSRHRDGSLESDLLRPWGLLESSFFPTAGLRARFSAELYQVRELRAMPLPKQLLSHSPRCNLCESVQEEHACLTWPNTMTYFCERIEGHRCVSA